MTTVAFDGNTLCADTKLVTASGQILYRSKLVQGFGYRAACCGDVGVSRWMQSQLKVGQPLHAVLSNWPRLGTADDAQADMLLVTPQQLFLIAGGFVVEIKHRNFHAIGSGGEYALGAMSAGCDARKALEVAALIDAFTGGDIETAPEFTVEEIAKCVLVKTP